MECSCAVPADNNEQPDFCVERDLLKSRKNYQCYECRDRINIGDRYNKITGKWDGTMDTFRTCSDCVSVKNVFYSAGYCFGNIWDDLYDFLRGTVPYNDFSWSCLAELTPKAREKVCEIIEGIWESLDEEEEEE